MEALRIGVERHYKSSEDLTLAKSFPPSKPHAASHDIPQERIDMIFGYLDDGKLRRIHVNCKLPKKDTNHTAPLWLAKPILMPVVAHILIY